MAVKTKTPRILAAAKEFNIGRDTLINFLESNGFEVGDFKPTSRLTAEMYGALQDEFQQDRANKRKSEQIDLPRAVAKEKKKKEASVERTSKKEVADKPEVTETSSAPAEKEDKRKPSIATENDEKKAIEKEETEGKSDTPEQKPEEEKKGPGPNVVGKIDLSKIDTSTRPKKKKKETPAAAKAKEKNKTKEAPKAKKEEKAADKSSSKEQPSQKEEKPNKETPKTETQKPTPPKQMEAGNEKEENIAERKVEQRAKVKLTGPRLVGKIDLPEKKEKEKDSKEKRHKKRKRKRIPVESKGAAKRRSPNKPGNKKRRKTRGKAVPDKEIDDKEIQDKIRQTQAKLSGSGKNRKLKARKRKAKREERAERQAASQAETENTIQVTEFISVNEFANLMDVGFTEIISKCMSLGIMVSINQRLDAEVIELVASEFGFDVEFIDLKDQDDLEEEVEDDPEDLEPRSPIITIMGHVDHGKTSLLDYIRKTTIVAGEVGGITQHIGAYEVTLASGKQICFLDTPGHEAFTAMRARGATVGDVAVIVIAADDAIMPQTKEAISHAQAAGLPMIFAINKVDKEGANPDKIKEQLAGMNILVEDWGGKFQSQEISAKKGLHIDQLLDKILLESDLLELKANPKRAAVGTVIDASLDKGRGYVTSLLIQNGTLNKGDMIVAGPYYGRMKALFNERGQRIEKVPPSTPVQVLGLNGAPQSGEKCRVHEDESEAKAIANERSQIMREQSVRARKHITLEEIGRRLALGSFQELNIIIKGDVDGSVEALSDSFQKLSTEEIVVNVVHKAVGQITESDVLLATASDAVIVGFQVRPSSKAAKLADNENIEIRTYSIIYEAIEEIKSAMEGMLEPKIKEEVTGNVEIRETYRIKKMTIAGCFVQDGKINRNSLIRVIRDGIVVHSGELGSLKRYQEDVKEMKAGMECGLTVKNYNDIKEGDVIEAYEEVEVKRTLS